MQENIVEICDPSLIYRPEKVHVEKNKFRNFSLETVAKRVKDTYYLMHEKQTVEFVKNKVNQYGQFNNGDMTVMEVLDQLNNIVDQSDPDVDVPNIYHAFQTAERIREKHPDKDWFQLTGLLHDLGKLLACYGEPQWAVVGDTFPVGCAFSPNIVFGTESFMNNPDNKNTAYNSRLGMYEESCGLENVLMSWGHDEYIYQVLVHNKTTLPDEALYVVRFHSFYSWHTCGDYMYLCNNRDAEMLKWVNEFNQFDLYSKADDKPDVAKLTPYYQMLIDKYCPGKLKW